MQVRCSFNISSLYMYNIIYTYKVYKCAHGLILLQYANMLLFYLRVLHTLRRRDVCCADHNTKSDFRKLTSAVHELSIPYDLLAC